MERFAADRMLGKLAKWLRVLGYDVVYLRRAADEEVLRYLQEGRTLLTRNRRAGLWQQQGKVFVVNANDPKEQLREVVQGLGLCMMAGALFSRCLNCNELLERVRREEVREQVPEYIWQAHKIFYWCEDCQKVYWPGSHSTKMRQRLEKVLAECD